MPLIFHMVNYLLLTATAMIKMALKIKVSSLLGSLYNSKQVNVYILINSDIT